MEIWTKLVENLKFRTNIEFFKVKGFETLIRLKPTLVQRQMINCIQKKKDFRNRKQNCFERVTVSF